MDQKALGEALKLERDGVEPTAEYTAAAGPGWGWIKVWKTDSGYLVYWGNDGGSHAVFEKQVDIEDQDELASWLEWQDLEPWEEIEQRANVRGAAAVPEAKDSDPGPFYILVTRYWYGATETSSLVMDERGREPFVFDSFDDARAWIESEESEVYYLAHNEYARPSYKVVSI